MSGKLIVIEGGDGAGKATQAALLIERLRTEGKRVETIEFPRYTETFFGKHIREWLDGRHGDFVAVPPHVASVLYAGDRFESKALLEQWLSEGAMVIVDRYVSANMLHQGAKISDSTARTEFVVWLEKMEYEVFGIPRPDAVVYLDMPAPFRHQLLLKDETRTTLDLTEINEKHQQAVNDSAAHIAALQGWYTVPCVINGTLRTAAEIHEVIYQQLKGLW